MGNIRMIKGGLAWLFRRGGVVGDVVNHSGIGSHLGVYRREEGGRNSKYIASKSITGQHAELDVL